MPDMLESMRARLRALETENQDLQDHVSYLRRRLLEEAEKSTSTKQNTSTPTKHESAPEKSPQTETSAPTGSEPAAPASPMTPVTPVHRPTISPISPFASIIQSPTTSPITCPIMHR